VPATQQQTQGLQTTVAWSDIVSEAALGDHRPILALACWALFQTADQKMKAQFRLHSMLMTPNTTSSL
jgi:hypothetical protein